MSNNGIATSIDKLYSLNLEGDEKTGEEQRGCETKTSPMAKRYSLKQAFCFLLRLASVEQLSYYFYIMLRTSLKTI